jgi:EpsI family protein
MQIMESKTTSQIIASICMVAAAIGAWGLEKRMSLVPVILPAKLESSIPLRINNWVEEKQVSQFVVSPELQANLDKIYSDLISRVYVNERGERIMLVIAYGENQSEGTALHYPEVCYPAQGFSIDGRNDDSLNVGDGDLLIRRVLTNHSKERYEPVTYWTVVGGEVVRGKVEKKFVEIKKKWNREPLDGYLVRVSSINKNSIDAFKQQDEFVRQLLASVDKGMRKRLAGGL